MRIEHVYGKESEHIENMILVPRGKVNIGSTEEELDWIVSNFKHHSRSWYEDELPQRTIDVPAFHIDAFPVTNSQFKHFVESSGYITESELCGRGLVYTDDYWEDVEGASWQSPSGRGSSIDDRLDHPVVHVSWNDAQAYVKWAGKRLPTETEWERAAKGENSPRWPWGNEWNYQDQNTAEYWIGMNDIDLKLWKEWWISEYNKTGGMPKTSPVGSFQKNASIFGIYDLSGNVYEYTASTYEKFDQKRVYDEMYEAIYGKHKVVKGGSWMNFKYQVRCNERIAVDPHYSNFATGFRCAKDAEI